MDRACENCRFCVYAHSMRGKEEKYCERHSKYIGDTLLCSKWEKVSVPKPRTNADRIRSMSDEELAKLLTAVAQKSARKLCESLKTVEVDLSNCNFHILYEAHLDWLKQEAKDD